MKKTILFLSLIILFGFRGFPQTHISGNISGNATWNTTGAPYIIDGNTLIQTGVKVTIEAGVTVKFSGNTTLLINGELDALGDSLNHILITSNSANPNAGDWNNIHFSSTSVPASYDPSGNYTSGSIMKFCDILYGGQSNLGILEIDNAAPHIANDSIMYSSSAGIYLKKGYSKIENCYVSENSGAGIYSSHDGVYNDLHISDNSIFDNGEGGIYVDEMWQNKIYITSNKISGNLGGGIYINASGGSGSGTIHIVKNTIDNNTADQGAGISISSGFNIDISCNIIEQNTSSNAGSAMYIASGNNQYTNAITGNYIINNTSSFGDVIYLYFITYYNISMDIKNNMIYNNIAPPLKSVFYIAGSSYPILFNISNNTIKWNTGFSAFNLVKFRGSIHQNNISNNTTYEIYNQNSSGTADIDATGNYWYGSPDIDAKVYDFFDNGNISVVNYQPVLTDSAIVTSCIPPVITGAETIPSKNTCFQVYPVPVRDVLIVETLPEYIGSKVILCNLTGQELIRLQLRELKTGIDTRTLPKGIYFVKLVNDRKIEVKKIIKE
ncbi:MAG: right-handed parallel beta-helix repeat-containing protein [Bacteroidetes bacterium]|nr:right-handed parallel beta-helix repeat-containing protein [Bacteroidota bacterium]